MKEKTKVTIELRESEVKLLEALSLASGKYAPGAARGEDLGPRKCPPIDEVATCLLHKALGEFSNGLPVQFVVIGEGWS